MGNLLLVCLSNELLLQYQAQKHGLQVLPMHTKLVLCLWSVTAAPLEPVKNHRDGFFRRSNGLLECVNTRGSWGTEETGYLLSIVLAIKHRLACLPRWETTPHPSRNAGRCNQ